FLLGHPTVPPTNLQFELAVTIVVIVAAVGQHLIDTSRCMGWLKVVEINHPAVVLRGKWGFTAQQRVNRFVECHPSQVVQRNIKGKVSVVRDARIDMEYIRQFLIYQFRNDTLCFTTAAPQGRPTFSAFIGSDGTNADTWSETMYVQSCILPNETRVLHTYIVKCYRL